MPGVFAQERLQIAGGPDRCRRAGSIRHSRRATRRSGGAHGPGQVAGAIAASAAAGAGDGLPRGHAGPGDRGSAQHHAVRGEEQDIPGETPDTQSRKEELTLFARWLSLYRYTDRWEAKLSSAYFRLRSQRGRPWD